MKKFFLYIFLLGMIFSCSRLSPKGEVTLKTIHINDFTQIDGKGKFRVFLVNSPQQRIEVETYPNIFDNLDISSKDGKLKLIEKRETGNVDLYNITIYSRQNPTGISLSDSIDFNVSGEIKADNFKLQLGKQSKFIGALRTKNAEIKMQDYGHANIKGFTKNAKLKLKDSAGIIAPYWNVEELNLNANNGAYTEVAIENLLMGNLGDTSKLLYYGNPKVELKQSKSSKIQHKQNP